MIESFIFYKSFFKMAELITNPMEKFALYDAIIQYAINGTEPQFDESFLLARISWEGIKPQIDANTKRKYDGKKGGRPKEEIEKTSGFENKKPVVSEENNQWFPEEITSGFENKKPNNNVNDNNNENNNINDNKNNSYPTKDKILKLAKDPSVALPPDEAEKFFDHYTAQSWTRSNGQPIANTPQALVSMLRMWKSNSGNFNKPVQQTFSYQPQKSRRERIDETIRNNKECFEELFSWVEGHQFGEHDYRDSDPKGWDDWSYREDVLNKIENEGFSKQFKIYAKYRKEN